MNHHFNPDDEITQDKKEDSKPVSQMIEEAMLDEYFLLVRRIPGISLSPKECWELKTKTDTFKVYYGDLVVIDDDKIIDHLKHGMDTICLNGEYRIKKRDYNDS